MKGGVQKTGQGCETRECIKGITTLALEHFVKVLSVNTVCFDWLNCVYHSLHIDPTFLESGVVQQRDEMMLRGVCTHLETFFCNLVLPEVGTSAGWQLLWCCLQIQLLVKMCCDGLPPKCSWSSHQMWKPIASCTGSWITVCVSNINALILNWLLQ